MACGNRYERGCVMKKIILLVFILGMSLFANDIKFYTPSFDCSKVKENSIEYKICRDEKLSQLDKELSKVYGSFYFISQEIKSDQIAWIKKRNRCIDNICIQKAYTARIQKLMIASANQNNFPKEALEFFKKADLEMEQSDFEFLTKEQIKYKIQQKEKFFRFQDMHYQKPIFKDQPITKPDNFDEYWMNTKSVIKKSKQIASSRKSHRGTESDDAKRKKKLDKLGIFKSEKMLEHDTGSMHPESIERYQSVLDMLKSSRFRHDKLKGRNATVSEFLLAHSPEYHDLAKYDIENFAETLRTGDTAVCDASYEVVQAATGAVLNAVDQIAGTDTGARGKRSRAFADRFTICR